MTGLVQFFGISIGLGMIVIGAGLGNWQARRGRPRRGLRVNPQPPTRSPARSNLPLFLLEGVAILAEVFALLVLFLGR